MRISVCLEGEFTQISGLIIVFLLLIDEPIFLDWTIISIVLVWEFLNNHICRYNLLKLVDHFDGRGLYRSIFLRYQISSRCASLLSFVCIYWPLIFFTCLTSFFSFSIMEGEKGLEKFSPEIIVRNPSSSGAVSLLPHIILFHGTSDYSIPCDSRLVYLYRDGTNRLLLNSQMV